MLMKRQKVKKGTSEAYTVSVRSDRLGSKRQKSD